METQDPVPVASPRRPKILLVFVGIVVAALFIALNVWVYKLATKPRVPLIVPSSGSLRKPSAPTNAPQEAQVPASPSFGVQPTPLPPPPIPPDPVPPVNVGPESVGR